MPFIYYYLCRIKFIMRLLQPDSVWSQDAVKVFVIVFALAEDDVQHEVIRVSGVVDDGGPRQICDRV